MENKVCETHDKKYEKYEVQSGQTFFACPDCMKRLGVSSESVKKEEVTE